MKRGPKPKYKTQKERIQKWQKRNSEKPKKDSKPASADTLNSNERISKLETEVKEILLSLEEVLKEQKKLNDLAEWGKK